MIQAAVVIPFYNHEQAIGSTVAAVKPLGLPAFLVDDGSDPRCAPVLDALAASERGWLTLLRLPVNQGKGVAVMAGLEAAQAAGATHALQLDADGQHDPAAIPALLQAAQREPRALVSGQPIYDDSVPRSRLYGRYVTHVWVWINTLSLQIRDSMCGFRVYPIAPSLEVWRTQTVGKRMDFDTEIMVRLYWLGTPVRFVPARVRYPADGVSHFDLWRDNLRISRMHARLFLGMLWRLPRLLLRDRGLRGA